MVQRVLQDSRAPGDLVIRAVRAPEAEVTLVAEVQDRAARPDSQEPAAPEDRA